MCVDGLCGVGGGLGGEVVEVLMWSRILFWDSVLVRSESVCCEFAGWSVNRSMCRVRGRMGPPEK